MENPEEVLHALDDFAKLKPKDISEDLEKYMQYVALSGDPVYQWSLIKSLFRQKLINVISKFFETCPLMDNIPPCPNVEPFVYDTMRKRLLERFDTFSGAPFTIQRLAELLTSPTKQYNRVDKFMRAVEKNIWVVSTRELGRCRNDLSLDNTTLVNGVLAATIQANNLKAYNDRLDKQQNSLRENGDENVSVDNSLGEPQLESVPLDPVPDDTNQVLSEVPCTTNESPDDNSKFEISEHTDLPNFEKETEEDGDKIDQDLIKELPNEVTVEVVELNSTEERAPIITENETLKRKSEEIQEEEEECPSKKLATTDEEYSVQDVPQEEIKFVEEDEIVNDETVEELIKDESICNEQEVKDVTQITENSMEKNEQEMESDVEVEIEPSIDSSSKEVEIENPVAEKIENEDERVMILCEDGGNETQAMDVDENTIISSPMQHDDVNPCEEPMDATEVVQNLT